MTDVFSALADPSRRRLLEELAGKEASVTELAQTLPVTRQAVAKHMAALASAGLVESRRVGRERLYRLNPEPLDGAAGWIARVGSEWDERLGRLRDHVGSRTVAVEVASVHAEPDERSEQVTQALRGRAVTRARDSGRLGEGGDGLQLSGLGPWRRSCPLSGPARGYRCAGRVIPSSEAREYLGAPYQWGGMTENGIDCSGLVHMAYRRLGMLVPRDARDQEAAGERVARPRLGDLVTYGQGPNADHIAFWLGNGRILHAVGSRGVVEEPEPVELRRTRRHFVRLAT